MVPRLFRNIRLRRLTKVDVAFLHFKFALAVMLWLPMLTSPTMQAQLNYQMMTVWLVVTVIGFATSVVGLVMGAQGPVMRVKGFRVELAGLWLLMAGPLVFLSVQAGVWYTTGEQRALAVMFPYVVGAAILARIVMVTTSMRTVLYKFPGEDDEDA